MRINSGRIIGSLLVFTLLVAIPPSVWPVELTVCPRIITPDTTDNRQNAYFVFPFIDDPKPQLEIYDISGRKVMRMPVTDNNTEYGSWGFRLKWNGKDDSGNTVPPGVYIYLWQESAGTTTGTIVVAR